MKRDEVVGRVIDGEKSVDDKSSQRRECVVIEEEYQVLSKVRY